MKSLGNGKFEIRNKRTGETKVVSETELSTYGLKAPTISTTKSEEGGVKGTIRKASGILDILGLGAVTDIGNQVAGITKYGVGGITNNPQLAREGYNQVSQAQQKFGFAPPDTQGNQFNPVQFATKATKDAAGLASWGVPLSKGPLAVKLVLSGGAGALSEISQENATPDSIRNSAILSALFPVATTAGKGITKKFVNTSDRWIKHLFKPSFKDIDVLERYGKVDFIDEMVKNNDIAILDKKPEKVISYFKTKIEQINKQKADILFKINDTVPNDDIVRLVDNKIKDKSKNTVLQSETVKKLVELKGELLDRKRFRNNIDLPTLDQLKASLQNAAKSFYLNDAPTPTSDTLADVAREINDIIEDRITQAGFPSIKRINQLNMYYHVACDSFRKMLNTYENSSPSLKRFLGPAFFAPVLGYIAYQSTGNPAMGLGGVAAPFALSEWLRTPANIGKVAQFTHKRLEGEMPEWLAKLGTIGVGRSAGTLSK